MLILARARPVLMQYSMKLRHLTKQLLRLPANIIRTIRVLRLLTCRKGR